MPTLNINGNIRTNTAAGWAADATVYTAKTILITTNATYGTTDQRKFKIADGTQTWSNLDYFPVSGYDDATSSIQSQLDSKKGLMIQLFTPTTFTVSDGQTYYFGANGSTTPQTTETFGSTVVSVACTVKSIYGLVFHGVSSSESVTFSFGVNGSYTAIATVSLDSPSSYTEFNLTGQSIALSAGDKITIKMVCPSFVTNPTSFRGSFNLYAI